MKIESIKRDEVRELHIWTAGNLAFPSGYRNVLLLKTGRLWGHVLDWSKMRVVRIPIGDLAGITFGEEVPDLAAVAARMENNAKERLARYRPGGQPAPTGLARLLAIAAHLADRAHRQQPRPAQTEAHHATA